jgi:hypothetical protein
MKAGLRQEWLYRYQERLGILCQGETPTEQQEQLAKAEADRAIAELSAFVETEEKV